MLRSQNASLKSPKPATKVPVYPPTETSSARRLLAPLTLPHQTGWFLIIQRPWEQATLRETQMSTGSSNDADPARTGHLILGICPSDLSHFFLSYREREGGNALSVSLRDEKQGMPGGHGQCLRGSGSMSHPA